MFSLGDWVLVDGEWLLVEGVQDEALDVSNDEGYDFTVAKTQVEAHDDKTRR